MKFTIILLICVTCCVVECSKYADDGIFTFRNNRIGSNAFKSFDREQNELDGAEEYNAENTILEMVQKVLTSCDKCLGEAERRMNLALNQISSFDGESNLAEVFLSSMSTSEFYLSPFSWKSLSRKSTDEDVDLRYLENLATLVATVGKACSALPSALPYKLLFDSGKEEMVAALVHWSKKWFRVIEEQMLTFLDKCQSSTECSQFLTQVLNLSLVIVEEEKLLDISEVLDGIFALLNSGSYFGQNVRDIVNLWSELVDPVKDPYWLAERLSSKGGNYNEHIQSLKSSEKTYGPNVGDIEIDPHILVHEVPEEFLSIAIGNKLIQEHFRDLPEKRTRLVNLASNLSPFYIRVGGSGANFMTYDPQAGEGYFPKIKGWSYDESWTKNLLHPKLANGFNYQKELCEKQMTQDDFSNFTMTGTEWKFIVDLVKELKSVLLYDFNQFMRDEYGSWDPTNARLIMQDEATKQIPVIWQLGNEPNSYKMAFGWELKPQEAAIDYKTLKKELERFDPNKKHFIVGPDVTRPKKLNDANMTEDMLEGDSVKYLSIFLKHAGDVVDTITWHQYYLNGRTASLRDFTSVENMNVFIKQVNIMAAVRDKWAPNKPIWLTETANTWGGGSYSLSRTFAATFLWLDKLGAAALGGISMVYRQTLYGGCYGLLDRKLRPIPNYWVSVLHKQLVGQEVLLPRVRLAPDGIRVYAHCMNKKHDLYKKGAVVVFGMNTGEVTASLKFSNKDQQNSTIYEFKLYAPIGDLESPFILLNGEVLEVNKAGELPPLRGQVVPSGQLVMPPKSIMFYVLQEAQINFC